VRFSGLFKLSNINGLAGAWPEEREEPGGGRAVFSIGSIVMDVSSFFGRVWGF
jgi:hypothetical protein